jgi:hypothetical protein
VVIWTAGSMVVQMAGGMRFPVRGRVSLVWRAKEIEMEERRNEEEQRKGKLTGHVRALGAELNHDCQTNDTTDQRAVIE